jgi:hypothetical protein
LYFTTVIKKSGISMFKNKYFVLIFLLLTVSTLAIAQLPSWSYDPGPDKNTGMGRELIDLVSNIPNMPEISNNIMGKKQKFRPAFGPIPWRMLQGENKVKMLFVGQDGTHIAEAAGRPATAGFGGRAQDLANYFGVNEGAAFINAYSFTIKGQYGIYNTPFFFKHAGEIQVGYSNLVDNNLWSMSNSLKSPIVKWRNNLIDWVIKNNKDSMKLIVLFGGAARDALASYAQSKGAVIESADVYARVDTDNDGNLDRIKIDKSTIQVAETKEEYAGGNNTFPSLIGKDGEDLYAKILKRKLNYSNSKDQKAAIDSLESNIKTYLDMALLTQGGRAKNGLLNMAQLSGYNLNEMYINGIKTRSLKGLKLNDGTVIENDIIVVELPHPSSLSRTVMNSDSYSEGKKAASKRVMTRVKVLDSYANNGWLIEPDHNKTNFYAQGESYVYGRSNIGPEFYDFGTPANRMVSKSTARRMSGAANVVIIGTRDNGQFSKKRIKNMTAATASVGLNPDNLFIARPSSIFERYDYDSGPSTKMAKIMKTTIDFKDVFTPKTIVHCMQGVQVLKSKKFILLSNAKKYNCPIDSKKMLTEMSFFLKKKGRYVKDNRGNKKAGYGIDSYNVKSHPSVADFGHYRGTFNSPKIIILADPIGYDDIVTSRAMTGERGQYTHGLMQSLGVNDKYLVIKTVPFAMDNATSEEYLHVLNQTENYRDQLFKEVLKDNPTALIVADGEYAHLEAKRLFSDREYVEMNRKISSAVYGIKDAGIELAKLLNINETSVRGNSSNIPRSHLSFYSRVWEGTSGDRVITSEGTLYKGIAFAEVVPSWAFKQKKDLSSETLKGVNELISTLRDNGLPIPFERVANYVERMRM